MRAAVATLLLCSGCLVPRPATVPIPAVLHPAPAGEASGLVVLMPGVEDEPGCFEEHGFVERIQALAPHLDVVAVDAHLGYYRTRSVVERLHVDLIGPARERHGRVWLVGISLGGFGSALYAMEHPDAVEGLILLAPFLGEGEPIDSVLAAGGLARWTARDAGDVEDDAARRFIELWSWLRGYATASESMPELYLGFGTEDRFAVPNGLVADVLPRDHVLTLPGGHGWDVWKPLFAELGRRALASGSEP